MKITESTALVLIYKESQIKGFLLFYTDVVLYV